MIRPFLGAALSTLAVLACGSTVEEESDGSGGETSTGEATATTAAATTGAGGEAPTCDPPPSPEPFELGTGEKCFARLASLETVPMIQGPQGGYHLWTAVGCDGCSSPLHLRYGVNDPVTGMPLAYGPSEVFADLKGDGWKQKAGITNGLPGISWAPEDDPPLPEGTHVLLWVELLNDTTVVDHREVELIIGPTVIWDPCIEDPNNDLCQLG